MKKVLYLTNIPAPYTVDFYNELGKYVDLTVVFERLKATNRKQDWYSGKADNYKSILLKGMKVGEDFVIGFDVLHYLKTYYDIIIIGNYASPTGVVAINYMKRHRIPYYIHADGAMVPEECKIKFWFKKSLLANGAGFFSSGKVTDGFFKHYGENNCNEEIRIFRYPFTSVREDQFLQKPIPIEQKRRIRKEKWSIMDKYIAVFVGGIIPRKGIDILIRAAKLMPSSVGVYVVGGQPTKDLIKLMYKLDVKNVHFHDFVPPKDIYQYLRYSDIFVFPTRYDIWGLVVNEAVSQGLPIITTKKCVAGLELVKEGQNGFLIESDDYKIMADKVRYLINNEGLLYKYGEASLKIAMPYTIENMGRKYAEAINSIPDSER